MQDDGGDVRYYGASPNNYVYFNCSNYSSQTSSTCELWRIIGVFNGKVKIMKNSSIGALAWSQDKNIDSSKTTFYNDWSTSSLKVLLNGSYYKGTGTVTYYSMSGGNSETILNMASIGLKNNATRNMILESTWSLLSWTSSKLYLNILYEKENGEGKVYTGRPTSWTGKIALPYASDYGYAADLSLCKQTLYNYDDSTCTANNWMYNILGTENGGWLLTPSSEAPLEAWYVYKKGSVGSFAAYSEYEATPTIYLDTKTNMSSGSGTSSNPYKLVAS